MKIAISGCGGTGKTTLAHRLSEELNYPMIEEGVRDWLWSNNFNDFKEMSIEDIVKMQEFILSEKTKKEEELPSFVSDRTTIDNLSYALRWIGSLSKNHDTWMAQYITMAMNHAENNYDIIFILPWGELELNPDGIRSTNEWYQYMIQCIIERHLYMLERPMVYEVEKVKFDDRIKECLRIINSVKNNPDLGLQ